MRFELLREPQNVSDAGRVATAISDRANSFRLGFVISGGVIALAYVGFAEARLGWGSWLLGAVLVLLVVTCSLVWTLSPSGLSTGSGGSRDDALKRAAYPFAAMWMLAVLWPEFVFGQPGNARVAVILLSVATVFCLLMLLAYTHRGPALVKWAESRATSLAVAAVVLHAIIFGAVVILRHVYFNAEHGEDTAYYNQIFWNTLQGEFFRGSVTQDRYLDPPVSSEFAIHNSPFLFLVLPFYTLFPSLYTLLVLKNALLSAGGFALFLLAKDKIGGAAGVVVMVAYFLSANIVYQAINGFYPLHFIALCLPFAFLYFSRDRFWPFVFWLVLALSVREEIALTVPLFGVYALLLRRNWRWVAAPILLSVVWWVVSTEFVLVRSRIVMEELDAFYAAFGDGHNSALASVIENPGTLLGVLLTHDTLAYLYEVGKSTAAFPILSPSLLFALPTVAVNAIIGAFMPAMRNISYHYSIVASVCVVVAMIDGLARLSRHSQRFGMERQVFLVGMVVLLIPGMALGVGDIFRYGGVQGTSIAKDISPRPDKKTLEKVLALVPPNATVAAPNSLMPNLSKREGLYSSDRFWRYGDRQVDYMILDTRFELLSDNDRNKRKYQSVVAKIRGDSRYALVFQENGFEVYHLVAG